MYLHALTTAVPEQALLTSRAADLLRHICPDERTARLMRRLLPKTEIDKRHLAVMNLQSTLEDPGALYRSASIQPEGPGMNARSLAFHAAADELVKRVLEPVEEDSLARTAGLITVSCTHASSPGLERAVYRHSRVPHSASRWNLGFMGCSAALAGIRLAQHMAVIDPVLMVACEVSSLHFQYSADPEQLTANLLFADGAAAAILSAAPTPVRLVHSACITVPGFADQMVWWAGDFGLRLTLSPELPATLADHLPAAVARFLHSANVSSKSIEHWLVHPGGPQILDAVGNVLNLPDDALALSRAILRNYGNMSSPTILFILKAAIQRGLRGHTLMLAFGPGLTIEMALLSIENHADVVTRGEALLR